MCDMVRRNRICHSSVVLKKELCVYDSDRKSQYDLELWLRMLFENRRLLLIDNVLTYHRIHKGQNYEGRMGKIYAVRSFKLKLKYSLKSSNYSAVMYNIAKLVYDLLLPRKFKVVISSRLGFNEFV